MNESKQRNPVISSLIKIQRHLVNRIVWPYSFEHDSLIKWRAVILSSILIAGLVFGIFAFIAAAVLIIQKNAWGLAVVDIIGLVICLTFIFVHRIRFEIRASISLLMFYVIGMAIVLTVGPLSGGPAWLFAFAVIAGVLMGGYAAFVAILMNAIFISAVGILISTGKFGNEFPFFNTPQAMISAGVNFIVLNAITAVSVSALVNGLFHIFKKKEELANGLEKERFELIETKKSLESEIKDRKQTQKALQESEERFSLFMDYLPAIVFIKDEESKTLFVNKNMNDVLGAKDWIGKSATDLFPNDIAAAMIEDDKKTFAETHRVVIETVPDKNGIDHIYQTHKFKIERSGKSDLLGGIALDITQRIEVEEALKKSEGLFKLITGHTSALVSIHDSNANYIFASPSHERLGYKPENLIGQSGFTMMIEEDIESLLEHLDKAKHGKLSNAILNYRLKDKKGQIHNYRGSFDAVFKTDGSLERIICVGEDETELQQAQAEKINAIAVAAEAKKLALIGQVAGKMAHDFNNILGIIMGVSELSLMDCSDEKINKNLELILNQTIRGRNLTKNLVAFAKPQEPKQEFFKINEKIDLVLNLMRKDLENIEIRVDHGSDVPDVLADSGMIEHALVNLLQNSIHATSKTKYPRIMIRTYRLDKNIYFEIEDNGCGIPEEHLKDIYEPSFTLKGSKDMTGAYKTDIKGTGYGMANAKKYIEQHNGKISVESVVDSGTKFIISLPVVKNELSIEEKTEIQIETAFFGKTILLVEDEQALSDVQYRILTQDPCNHTVDTANSGQAAMDLFDRNQYDFISLDYVLPDKINGMDVYNHIRKKNRTVPILFVSGNIEFLESIDALKQKDMYIDHLSKPCMNIDYINIINKLFRKLRI